MEAPANEIRLPAPLEHQQPAYHSPARFKLLHPGRRWGKDRLAFTSAMAGHGPLVDGEPAFPGACQRGPHGGWWVGWVVRDFTQGSGIWREEFLPRFSPLPQIQTNKSEMRVTLPHGGGIFLCTAENIHSLRGLGKRMKGLVVNEAAWFDLEEAWLSVLRPVLVDNRGWAIIMSTPNSGQDGNATGLTPSYFNRLCLETLSGAKGPDWAVWGGDLRQNPALDADEAAAFLASYPADSLQLKEEGLGLLVPAGVGLAFPAWSPAVHLAEPRPLSTTNPVVLGMDWGIRAPSVVVAASVGEGQALTLFREWTWADKDAYEAGYDFGQALLVTDLPRWPEWLMVDSAMAERTGVGGGTILSEFQAGLSEALAPTRAPHLPVLPAPKGPGSRAAGYNQVTKLLSWGPALTDGSIPASRMPQLRIQKSGQGLPTCPMLASDLATLPLDPKQRDDVDKSRGGGHAYDACRYLVAAALPAAPKRIEAVPPNQHPGFLPNGQRRARVRTPDVVQQETRIIMEHQARQAGVPVGGRYGPRR